MTGTPAVVDRKTAFVVAGGGSFGAEMLRAVSAVP